MAGKIKEVKILGYDFVFVFRHRYEKDDENKLLDNHTMWREWELGFFFKRNKVVGKRNFSSPKKWHDNLVKEYMLGVNLLWCKAWFTVSKGSMNIKMNDDEK